jgi:uncharacterized protein (DUF1330 family)
VSKGYIYLEIEVINPLEYEHWLSAASDNIALFGGRFIVRRGEPRVLAGGRTVNLAKIVEFDSRERAMDWYRSAQGWQLQRNDAARIHAVLLTGCADAP